MHGHSSARARLSALGLRPNKRLSQSFLEDPRAASAIVRAAKLDPERDMVLEVGAGLGALTERLVREAREVVAIEVDEHLAESLRTQLQAPNLTVLSEDVLKFDPATCFDQPFVVVANLPYHITSPALRHLLGAGPPFARRLIVMVQAEVAERVAAAPGQLSALAVSIQAQARVRIVRRVARASFYPRPRVDSAVLSIEPLAEAERLIGREEIESFTSLVHAGFKQPRKILGNSLAEGLEINKTDALALIARAGLEAGRRPQELAVADWWTLFRLRQAG